MDIGGNTDAIIQLKTTGSSNEFGAYEPIWTDYAHLCGWLDLSGGESKNTVFNAKIQQSTHIFICDYDFKVAKLESETTRMAIDGKVYDIALIDNPMELNEHLEIYLRFVGGQ